MHIAKMCDWGLLTAASNRVKIKGAERASQGLGSEASVYTELEAEEQPM